MYHLNRFNILRQMIVELVDSESISDLYDSVESDTDGNEERYSTMMQDVIFKMIEATYGYKTTEEFRNTVYDACHEMTPEKVIELIPAWLLICECTKLDRYGVL